MNEIKQIHLGRQPFTIAVDAHKALQEYLHAIEKQVGKESDVIKEVELRMAELLYERGLTEARVVLPEDVTFLKEQLGAPHEFKEDEDGGEHHALADDDAPKRLYRDTEHGIIAGVASGLAAYFKIDPIILRLLFIVLVFSGGVGILLYILLWILVPEATTSSEKLQMRGKAVTVETIKETVGRAAHRADLPGATKRAGSFVRRVFGVLGAIVRYAFVAILTTVAVVMFVWTIITGTYTLIHGVTMSSEVIFPVGSEAVWGVVSAMLTLGVLALLLLTVAMSTLKRTWTIPGWVTATMIGVFFIAASVGTAIGFDIAPQFRDRYRQLQQAQTATVDHFSKVELTGKETAFSFQPDDDYMVEVKYFGKKELLGSITKQVQNGTLTVDTNQYKNDHRNCIFCVDPGGLEVILHAPTLTDVKVTGDDDTTFFNNGSLDQPALSVTVDNSVRVNINGTRVQKLALDASQNDATSNGLLKFTLTGLTNNRGGSRPFAVNYGTVQVYRVGELEITTGNRLCDQNEAFISSETALSPIPITLNGKAFGSAEELAKSQTENASAYNCLSIN